jgi:CheY-like chemotaxis protein
VGEGSCFCFELDLPRGEVEEDPESAKKSDESLMENSAPNEAFSPPKVLVVDDDPANVLVSRHILKRWGVQVFVACDGQEALEKCGDQTFDLILMDLSMPVMNGFEATERIIQSDGPNAKTPIIALSAHIEGDVRDRCHRIGMKEFVSKPVRIDKLRSVLTHAGLQLDG